MWSSGEREGLFRRPLSGDAAPSWLGGPGADPQRAERQTAEDLRSLGTLKANGHSRSTVHQVPLRRNREAIHHTSVNPQLQQQQPCSASCTTSSSSSSAAPAVVSIASWSSGTGRSCRSRSTGGSTSCTEGSSIDSSRGYGGSNKKQMEEQPCKGARAYGSCSFESTSGASKVARGRLHQAPGTRPLSPSGTPRETAPAEHSLRQHEVRACGRWSGQRAAQAADRAATAAIDAVSSPVCIRAVGTAATAAGDAMPAGADSGSHVIPSRHKTAGASQSPLGQPVAAIENSAAASTASAAARGAWRQHSGGRARDPALFYGLSSSGSPSPSPSFTSLTSSALGGVASLAQQVSSRAPVLLQSSKKAAAVAARKAVAVASAAVAVAAGAVAANSPGQPEGPFEDSSISRRSSVSENSFSQGSSCTSRSSSSSRSSSCSRCSSSSGRISSVAHDWAVDGTSAPPVGTFLSCVSSLQPPSPTATASVPAVPPLAFSAVAAHGAVRPVFSSSPSAGKASHEPSDSEDETEGLGLQLPPSPKALRQQEESLKEQTKLGGKTRLGSGDSDRRIKFAAAPVGSSGEENTLQAQQQQRSLAQMLPVISSPSYAFLDAQSLGELLALPLPSQTTLRVRVWRFRGMFPPRWLEEDLLLHQNLLLFCTNTEPLEVSLLVPLASVAAGWAVDGKGRVSAAAAGKGKAPYRMKLVAAAGAAAKAVALEKVKRPKGAKTILLGLESEGQRDTLLKHILYLADKWRSRPSVPDFLYRPPCQQHLVLLRKQLRSAARSLLISQLAALVRGLLRRWAGDFFTRIRSAAATAAAARDRQTACVSRGILLLQQWLRLRSRQDSIGGLQRLRLHALEQQQQQQAAAVVSTLATGHLQLATHQVEMARQQLKYALGRLVKQRMHAAFIRLLLFSSSVEMKQQTQKSHMLQLSQVLWKLQHQQLQAALVRLRKAALQRQLQQNALQQALQRMRQRRLKLVWKRLLVHTSIRRISIQVGGQKALLLVLLCIKARMRSCLRLLQRHAMAAAGDDKLRVCTNLQKVNERLAVSMRQIPKQRGVMLLERLLQLFVQQRLSWAFCCWRTNLHNQKQRMRAALLLLLLLQVKQQQLMQAAFVSLKNHVHDHRELYRQKMQAAWILGLLLREQELRELRFAWLCLQRPVPQNAFQTALQSIADVVDKAEFRALRGGFMKLQQMQATGETMRCFLRLQLLSQLVARLQLQFVKQQAIGFSALRSHAAILAACSATAKTPAPEQATMRSNSIFEADSPYCVSATSAAAASERLQHLLDMSSDLLGKQQQHSLTSETASCQKPLLYLPQPFAAEQAARAAAAARSTAQHFYAMHAPPSLLSQETSDGDDGCFLPSGGPQPTLLQLGTCGARRSYSPLATTDDAAHDAFDSETSFGASVASCLEPKCNSSGYSHQTRLVPPLVTLSDERGDCSRNFFSSSRVLDGTDYAAHEAELDALLNQIQSTSEATHNVTCAAPHQVRPAQQPQLEALHRLSSAAGAHAVRGRQPPQPQERALCREPANVFSSPVPYFSSCPTAVEGFPSPSVPGCFAIKPKAMPPR